MIPNNIVKAIKCTSDLNLTLLKIAEVSTIFEVFGVDILSVKSTNIEGYYLVTLMTELPPKEVVVENITNMLYDASIIEHYVKVVRQEVIIVPLDDLPIQ